MSRKEDFYMKRKSIIIILSAVTMLIVLVGCGGNSTSSVSTNDSGIQSSKESKNKEINEMAKLLPDPKSVLGENVSIDTYKKDEDGCGYIIDDSSLDDYEKYWNAAIKKFDGQSNYSKKYAEALTSDEKYVFAIQYDEDSKKLYAACKPYSE